MRIDHVVAKVRGDLLRRSLLGITKYGTTLYENPAPRLERLQHAYEEALDLANYLAWEIMRTEKEDGKAPTEIVAGGEE